MTHQVEQIIEFVASFTWQCIGLLSCLSAGIRCRSLTQGQWSKGLDWPIAPASRTLRLMTIPWHRLLPCQVCVYFVPVLSQSLARMLLLQDHHFEMPQMGLLFAHMQVTRTVHCMHGCLACACPGCWLLWLHQVICSCACIPGLCCKVEC